MFPQLSRLIADAGLKNCNINVQSVNGTSLTLILSFVLKDELPAKLLEDTGDANTNQNADSIIALRSALSMPLVVTCSPEDMVNKVGVAIAQLSTGVVEAAQTYSATDINAMLQKATKTVGAKNKKAAGAKAQQAASQSPDLDDDDAPDTEEDLPQCETTSSADTKKPDDAVKTRFADFDSIL